eukprot:GILI01022397.1.p1 GENE.GILI01022397.1~~GILI01022397.1.p1  ORF type:complete len:466 (-),score=61.78 GILI01022397.1:47-1312(-)
MHFIDIGAVKGTSTDDTADKSRRVGNEYTLLVTSEDGSIKVFALRSNASTSSSPASSNQQPSNQITFVLRHEVLTKVPITAASILPNQQILLTGTQLGRISVWHMPAILSLNGALSTTIPTSEGVDESQLNSATSNNVLQQKALVGPKPIQELSLEADPTSIRSIAVSPMSNFIAVASNIGRVHFFAFCRGEDALRERKEGDSAIATIRPIRNSNPHFNQSLNPYALEEFTFIVAHEKYILKIAIPPNCRYIATASADYTVGAFGVPDYLASGQFIAFSDLYNGLASTPNTAQEATFEDSKASADAAALQFPGGVAAGIEDPRLWFPLRRTFLGHQRWVWDCSISPCSSFILTVSSDHSGRLWKVEGDLSSPSPAPLSAERLVTDLANPQTTPPPTVVNTSIAVYNFHNKTVNCCLLDIEP